MVGLIFNTKVGFKDIREALANLTGTQLPGIGFEPRFYRPLFQKLLQDSIKASFNCVLG